MPTFDTPQPITATVGISAGSVRLLASDRDDTVVEVRPRDESRSHDVRSAEQVRVAFASEDFRFRGYRRALRRATVGRELALDRILARLLYGGSRWRDWLSLVLFDPEVLELYAARVAGGLVLADQKARLWWALARHVWQRGARRRQLDRALAPAPTLA